jgi:hypothetical protein
MKVIEIVLSVIVFTNSVVGVAAADFADDHFRPGEDVDKSFGWDEGAACTFSDSLGVVFRSNWMERHWIKVGGKQIELNRKVEMSDEGWIQMFTSNGITISMRLRRTGDRGDSVPMTGQIAIAYGGKSTVYEVKGGCGA